MSTVRLHGADSPHLNEISATGEGPAAIAISRGGAKKQYAYKDPNEDVVAYAISDWGLLAVAADGHAGHEGAEIAVDRVLERHAPRWLGTSAIALDSRFTEEAGDVVHDVNSAMVRAAEGQSAEPSRTTLSIGLVRPRDGFLAALSVGDSHVFQIRDQGAKEWLPDTGRRTVYLGQASHDRERLTRAVRADVSELGETLGLVLATDGLSELGIGVEDPGRAVGEACVTALHGDPTRIPIDIARGVVERALEAQRQNRAGDNAGVAVLWWDPPE